ncbi:bifunctional adenosylcobinamide kinase/adenosylcobinamide-phosphate guanylyltransferase [Lachnospiraceae bacterium ZAX-1]
MRLLLTGGAACGKSTYAKSQLMSYQAPRYYIDTMYPCENESLAKKKRHQKLRKNEDLIIIEQYTDIGEITFPARGTVLLECLCNLTANEMFDENDNFRNRYGYDVVEKIANDIKILETKCNMLIVVTNEVGGDGRIYEIGTREYVKALGKLNATLANRFERVVELVCGIPQIRKGQLP